MEAAGGDRCWKVEVVEGASHSPFLSWPGKVADAVRRVTGEVV